MIQKILLINPSFEDFYQTEIRQQPTGLKYIKASLEKVGYETFLLDCLSINKKRTIPIPNNLKYLKKFYPTNDLSPFKLFTHYRHFGKSLPEIADFIKNINPDLIGISINFTPFSDTAIKVAKICKTIYPEIPIIAGGHHATAAPKTILSTNFFDFVILGEGEQRILKLIEFLYLNKFNQLKNFDGIAYKDNENIKINHPVSSIQNLDEIPYPEINDKIGMILTSRGCPQNCNFCSVENVMGKKVRFRSIESVIDEINSGIQNGVRKFDFEDDNLTINRNRAKTLFRKIMSRFDQYNLQLSAMNGIMADSLDEDLIRLMNSAGFEWLNIPLVSGSVKVQQKINRFQSQKQFLNVVRWAQQNKLKVVAYIILGLPEDNLDQMLNDIIFLSNLPVLIGPSIFYPPPASETFNNCINNNYINGEDFSLYRSTAIPVETEKFSRRDIITLFRIVRFINYAKNLIGHKTIRFENIFDLINKEKIKNQNLIFNSKLSAAQIGVLLIDQLLQHKKMRGLNLKNKLSGKYEYEWIDYEITQSLVDKFLGEIKGEEISGIV